MDKLFGIPINQFMLALLVILAAGTAVVGFLAARNPVLLKMGVRNIPRRRAQTGLIVLGLMLATVLFSASLATGDTLTHSIRLEAVKALGEVDVEVRGETREASGRLAYFDERVVEAVREQLSQVPAVEAVAAIVREQAPVVALKTRQSEPSVAVLGYPRDGMEGFDRLVTKEGQVLSIASLEAGQAFLSAEASRELDAETGDSVHVFLGRRPAVFQVAGTYASGGSPAGEMSLAMPLDQLQEAVGEPGRVNTVLVTNRGGPIEGAEHTDEVLSALEPLKERGLEAEPVKRDALKQADDVGGMFSSIFLLFGQFSIAAGVLLIFLIFVMLAAERQHELGIARAVGARRGHVIRMFAFEGAVYALMAAAVGSLLGVGVGMAMVRIMAAALGQVDFQLTYAFRWQSVVVAFAMGIVLTFGVVVVASWRVSRLNIVRAIRDIPEPRRRRKTVRGLVLAVLLPVAGLVLTAMGLQGEQGASFYLGTSLVIIGLPLLARRFGLADRPAYTAAGVGVVTWWLLPAGLVEPVLPDMQMGIEMFFMSGIMIVLGAVWAVVYNWDLLLKATVAVLGGARGLAPVLRTSVAYAMQSKFRTGLTLAMFSLVVFTLIVMTFIIHSMASVFEDTDSLAGGFDVRAATGYANPVADLRSALEGVGGVADIEAIGSLNGAPVKVKQEGTGRDPVDFGVQGVDGGYSDSVTYGFSMMARGYSTQREVWQALQSDPGTAVVPRLLVPARTNYNVGGPTPDFRLEGFWLEDGILPDVFVEATDPRTGNVARLRVIGVLEEMAVYAQGIITSQDTLDGLLGLHLPPQTYMLRLGEGKDSEAVARALEAGFLEHGMQAQGLDAEIRKFMGANLAINNLLQGFMGLGLVVGIAALGVIAARSVVERRHHIGVLRAIGFQKGMVQLSFLLESSFVALLGIAMGVALGAGVSVQVVAEMAKEMEGVKYSVPWANIVIVVVIAYGAALLTTFLPARQAANVYPAEALRFE